MTTYHRLTLIAIFALLQSCASVSGPASENLGKRTLGTQWDDQMIESRSNSNIKSAHPEIDSSHINVTSFNGVVLLTGQVPSEAASNAVFNAVEGLRKVKLVHNELEIAGPTSLMSRTNDTWLTAKVKTALLTSGDIEGGRVKVITEDSVVYLMGLLTKNEADLAVDVARGVFGVQKIVKVFEFIN